MGRVANRIAKKQQIACGNLITVSREQLSDIVAREMEKKRLEIVDNVATNTTALMKAMCFIILHDKFGFGQGRLSKFDKQLDFHASCVMEGYVSIEDLLQICREEFEMVSEEEFHE